MYKVAVLLTFNLLLTFQDLSIQTRVTSVTIGGAVIGVGWIGGGKSVWNNVHIKSDYWSWIDICSSSGTIGEHKWFGSSLESGGNKRVIKGDRSILLGLNKFVPFFASLFE